MLTHRAKLLLIGAVLTICLGATLLLEAPEATRSVDEVMEDPESLEGREIAIRGEVLDGSIDNQTMIFILHGESNQLVIDFSQAQTSGGLDDNRTIYAEGILLEKDGEWIFEAEVIKTSCPSKYEESEAEYPSVGSKQSGLTACWDRRGVCVPSSANRKWRSESQGAAQPVYGFPPADVDVSPPRDPGVTHRRRKESGNE